MAKTAQFELIGTIVDHPKHKNLSRGDILTLEVGDDGKPTSELFRSRTRPLGKAVDQSETLGVKGATEKAAKILEEATERPPRSSRKLKTLRPSRSKPQKLKPKTFWTKRTSNTAVRSTIKAP